MQLRFLISCTLALAGCAAPAPSPVPEGASGWTAKAGKTATRFMVAAANPLATDAGYRVLQRGGTALDAAIAVQMVLTLVEPQSSGIGGGAFLMHFDGGQPGKVQAWDGRETAPAAADERLFLDGEGKPLPFAQARTGGRAVATPGVVKMLEAAHRQHGRLPWADLFEPAITLAERGFAMSPRLHRQLQGETALQQDPLARAYFYKPDGEPHPVGHLMQNPALAAVLRLLATQGSDALHSGAVAEDLVARVQGHAVAGRLSAADLRSYAPKLREPICTPWRVVYRVCGFPPPSSGHLAVMQILGLLEQLPAAAQPSPLQAGVPNADWLHLYTEASRLAYADRALFVADPDFVSAPAGRWTSLLDPTYLQQRAALIGPRSMGTATAGQPAPTPVALAPMPEQPEHGTSHISVVDTQGRAVAMTTTIEAAFGARLMANGGTGLPGGFLLNNQMTDFSATPADAQGRPVANRIEPGKRPRSSMSPTLVFDSRDGRLLMTLGSPGGPVIIHFTAKTLIGTLQWGLNPQAAIDLPNFGSLNGPTLLEKGRFPAATLADLLERGHRVVEMELTSGLQAIQRTPAGWAGGADPRREGEVRGE
ncbi:MAG: gamma-glutamyltransferase family protein [Rubrivivax sp.]|nr:gamma-glutamyltransferase family protein [Rubrivivax sp.]